VRKVRRGPARFCEPRNGEKNGVVEGPKVRRLANSVSKHLQSARDELKHISERLKVSYCLFKTSQSVSNTAVTETSYSRRNGLPSTTSKKRLKSSQRQLQAVPCGLPKQVHAPAAERATQKITGEKSLAARPQNIHPAYQGAPGAATPARRSRRRTWSASLITTTNAK